MGNFIVELLVHLGWQTLDVVDCNLFAVDFHFVIVTCCQQFRFFFTQNDVGLLMPCLFPFRNQTKFQFVLYLNVLRDGRDGIIASNQLQTTILFFT